MDSILDIIGNEGAQSLVAMLVIPMIIQKLKSWAIVQKPLVINIVAGLMSFITVAAESILSSNPDSYGMLGLKSVAIVGGIQYVYSMIIKPATQVLEDAKLTRQNRNLIDSMPIQNQDLVPAELSMEFDPNIAESVAPVENLGQ